MRLRIIMAVVIAFGCGSNCAKSDTWQGAGLAVFLAFCILLTAIPRTKPRPPTWHVSDFYWDLGCADCTHDEIQRSGGSCDRCDNCTVTPSGFEEQ